MKFPFLKIKTYTQSACYLMVAFFCIELYGAEAPTLTVNSGEETVVIDNNNSGKSELTASGGEAPDKGSEWEKDGEATYEFSFGALNATASNESLTVNTDTKGDEDITVKKKQSWKKKCDPSETSTSTSPSSEGKKREVQEPNKVVKIGFVDAHKDGVTLKVSIKDTTSKLIKKAGAISLLEEVTNINLSWAARAGTGTTARELSGAGSPSSDVPPGTDTGQDNDADGNVEDPINNGASTLASLVVSSLANNNSFFPDQVEVKMKWDHAYEIKVNSDGSKYGVSNMGALVYYWLFEITYVDDGNGNLDANITFKKGSVNPTLTHP